MIRGYGKTADKYRYENTIYRYVYRYDHDTDIDYVTLEMSHDRDFSHHHINDINDDIAYVY